MSLDDTTPTQYHGPGMRRIRINGEIVQVDSRTYDRLRALGYPGMRPEDEAGGIILTDDADTPAPDPDYEITIPEQRIISMDDMQVDPVYADMFTTDGLINGAEHTIRLDAGEAHVWEDYVTITDEDGTVTATFSPDGTLTGGTLRNLKAERDTAVENTRFWRRNFYIMAAASLVSLGVSFADLIGWY